MRVKATGPTQPLAVVVSNDLGEISDLVGAGFCPVECSVGGQSIVDGLVMDHHGNHSHLESVAVRAWRDHYGARASDPRFVVAGTNDADASFAMASLAGLVPGPDGSAGPVDMAALAAAIGRLDVDPIGVDLAVLPEADLVGLWQAMAGPARDDLGAATAVGLWRTLTTMPADRLAPFREAAVAAEAARFATAKAAMSSGAHAGSVLVLDGPGVWGFDVWYGRRSADSDPSQPSSWENPCVMARTADGNVTVGCPNTEVAEALFGPGGMKSVFVELRPEGWGGREAVGGSPRGLTMSAEQFWGAAHTVAAAVAG